MGGALEQAYFLAKAKLRRLHLLTVNVIVIPRVAVGVHVCIPANVLNKGIFPVRTTSRFTYFRPKSGLLPTLKKIIFGHQSEVKVTS